MSDASGRTATPQPGPDLSVETCEPTPEHAALIRGWRNDPETLAASFHRTPKEETSFLAEYRHEYFRHPEAPPVFVRDGDRRVAFLRFVPTASPHGGTRACVAISINVNPDVRGRGYGTRAILVAREYLRARGIDDVVAEIRTENAASRRAFEKAGFTHFVRTEKHVADTGERCPIDVYVARLTGPAVP